MTNELGKADHLDPNERWYDRLWANPPFRTFIQGLMTDLVAALALVFYAAVATGNTDFRLLLLSLLKTAVMTAVSYVMKKIKPFVHS